jgi:hypothetical protein
MDLQEQRITCLRMAVDMGCKADSVFGLANTLMDFVKSGAVPSAVASAPVAVSEDRTAAPETALELSEIAPGLEQAPEPTPTAVEAASGPAPEPPPSAGETAAALADAQVAASAPSAGAAGPVAAAEPLGVPGAAVEAGEPVSAASLAAPAGGAELADQPEMSSGEAANPAIEASGLADAVASAPTGPAPVAEPIAAEQSAASTANAETNPAAGDAPSQGASTEAPPPKSNGASTADAAIAAPTAS